MELAIKITFTPQGEAVCKNALGMTFFLNGEPPRASQAVLSDEPPRRSRPQVSR